MRGISLEEEVSARRKEHKANNKSGRGFFFFGGGHTHPEKVAWRDAEHQSGIAKQKKGREHGKQRGGGSVQAVAMGDALP